MFFRAVCACMNHFINQGNRIVKTHYNGEWNVAYVDADDVLHFVKVELVEGEFPRFELTDSKRQEIESSMFETIADLEHLGAVTYDIFYVRKIEGQDRALIKYHRNILSGAC